MYTTYFGFTCLPFDRVPKPDAVFESAAFLEARAALCGCVDRGAELALLIGPQGAGKTTTLRALAATVERDGVLVLTNDREAGWETFIDASLASLADAVGAPRGDDVTADRDGTRCNAVVLVDDAHDLPAHVLRHLPSLVTGGAELGARVTVVLAAQPEFAARLADARLGSLESRLTCRHELAPLAADEIGDYVRHKLEMAGYRGPELFDASAVLCLTERCGGNPRWVDLLCGLALLVAFDSGRRLVDERIVSEAANDHPGFAAGMLVADEESGPLPAARSPESELVDGIGSSGAASVVARAGELLRSLPALTRGALPRASGPSTDGPTPGPRRTAARTVAAHTSTVLQRLGATARAARAAVAALRARRSELAEQPARAGVGRGAPSDARERDHLEVKLAVTGVLTVGVLGLGVAVFMADAPVEPDRRSPAVSGLEASGAVARSPLGRLQREHAEELALLRGEMVRLRAERDEALLGLRTRQTTIEQDRAELARLRNELASAELELAQAAKAPRHVSLTLPLGTYVTFSGEQGERLEVGPRELATKGEALVLQARMSAEFVELLKSLRDPGAASSPAPAVRSLPDSESGSSVLAASHAPGEPGLADQQETAVEVAALESPDAGALRSDSRADDAVVANARADVSAAETVAVPMGVAVVEPTVATRPDHEARSDDASARPTGDPESVGSTGVAAPEPTPAPATTPVVARTDAPGAGAGADAAVTARAPAGTAEKSASGEKTPGDSAPGTPRDEVDVAAATLALASEPGASIATPIAAQPSRVERLELGPVRRAPAAVDAKPREEPAVEAPARGRDRGGETRRVEPGPVGPERVEQERVEQERVEPTVRPERTERTASIAEADYVVVAGDTLSGIARRMDVTIAELREWNGLDGDMLRIGQRLTVKSPHGVDNETNRALLAAAGHGQLTLVRALLAAGASPDARDEEGRTALMHAARRGHFMVVRTLAEHGADIRLRGATGGTALADAAWAGHAMVLSELLERGAEVDAANDDGWTPLMYASINGHLGCVQALIARGARIDARNDESQTALSAAVWNGHAEIVRVLLEGGAAVDDRMPGGWTALMEAAWNGDAAIVSLLLEHGADPQALSDAGRSPASLAEQQGHADVAAVISRSVNGPS